MAEKKKNTNLGDVPQEILANYYNHQYDRMGKLEEQRLAITNITITLSVLSFTFGFNIEGAFSRIVGFALLSVMLLANIFAAAYIVRTDSWIKTHELRAKGILKKNFIALWKFDQETHDDYGRWAVSRWQIQLMLHVLLSLVAVVIAVFLAMT
jgi:hypothetical protein